MNISLSQLIAIAGTLFAATLGANSLISRMVLEKVLSKWRRDEQSMIEVVKSALTSDRVLLESSIKGFQTGIDTSQPKRLEAIEQLWGEVLRLRGAFSQPLFFCSVFLPEEYESMMRDRRDLIALISVFDEKAIGEQAALSSDLERTRPYLGETLWLQFFIYRAFLCRITFVLSTGVKEGRLGDWRTDRGIKQILANVLPSDILENIFEKAAFVVAANQTVSSLEGLMLREISLIVSGRRSASESFENAKQMQDAINTATRSNSMFGTIHF
jgi:hypothetical protein